MEVEYFFDNSVFLFKPTKFFDDRGFLSETYNSKELEKIGINTKFVQENFSLSKSKNVFRGLHFQKSPHEQAKLIRVLSGSILDIVRLIFLSESSIKDLLFNSSDILASME